MGLDAYIYHDHGKIDLDHPELGYFRNFYELNDIMAKYSKSDDFNCEQIDLTLEMIDEVVKKMIEIGNKADMFQDDPLVIESFAFGAKMFELGLALEKARQLINQGERVYYLAWW